MFKIKREKSPPNLKSSYDSFCKEVKHMRVSKAYARYNELNGQMLYKYNTQETKELFRIMNYERCSFCGKIISDFDDEMTIEHIKLKSKFPRYIFKWSNLLCSCITCNRKRSTNDEDPLKYLDPTRIDVERYFEFSSNGEVLASSCLTEEEKEQSNHMIELYKLNRSNLVSKRKKFFLDLEDSEFLDRVKSDPNGNEHVLYLGQYRYYIKGVNDE